MIQVVWLSASEYVEASGGTIWTYGRGDPSSDCHPPASRLVIRKKYRWRAEVCGHHLTGTSGYVGCKKVALMILTQ